MFNTYKGKTLAQMKIHANQQAAEIERLRTALKEIRDLTFASAASDGGDVREAFQTASDAIQAQ